jgi:hypothetical protein
MGEAAGLRAGGSGRFPRHPRQDLVELGEDLPVAIADLSQDLTGDISELRKDLAMALLEAIS